MKCCVLSCKSYSDRRSDAMDGITFHLFPSEENLKQQWITKINRQNWNPTKYTKICSCHFNDADFRVTKKGRIKLKKGTLPCLKLDLSTHQPQTTALPNPSPDNDSDDEQVDDDDSIYERDVSPIRTEDDAEATVPEGSSRRHPGYRCDVCRGHIDGFRYACVECANFDLCAACEARAQHALHYVLRVPADKLHSDVQAVIKKIREELLQQVNIEEDSIKVEVPEEVMKQEDPLEGTAESLRGDDSQYAKSVTEGGGQPVFEVQLSHQPQVLSYQPAVPQVFSHGPQVSSPRPAILSYQHQILTHQPAVPQVLSRQPVVLSQQPQVLSHQPAVLSHQPAVLSLQPQVLSHQPAVLSHQPAVLSLQPQVLSHQPAVLSHQPADLSHQPKAQSKVKSKVQPKVSKATSHQPSVLSHHPAVPQPQVPQSISEETRPLIFAVQGLDTVRGIQLAGALGVAGVAGGAEGGVGKEADEGGSYAVYTHRADPSGSAQDEGAQSEETSSACEESTPTGKKRKK